MAHRCKRFRIARLLALRESTDKAWRRAHAEDRHDQTWRLYGLALTASDDFHDVMNSPKGRRIRRRFEREAAALAARAQDAD